MKTFLRMAALIFAAQVSFWCLGYVWHAVAGTDCQGWNCETVNCPTGYAVQITEFHFLPCDEFFEFTKKGDDSVLAVRRDVQQ